MTKHFATLDGIKRAAKKLKRRTGIPHAQALEQIAKEAGYADYFAASQALGALAISPGKWGERFEPPGGWERRSVAHFLR